MKIIKIIEELKEEIKHMKKNDENMNAGNWGHQVGIIITGNEAVAIVKAFETKTEKSGGEDARQS